MTDVDNVDVFETGSPQEERARAQLTSGTSEYKTQKINRIVSLIMTVEGTNTMTYTFSGTTITILGTNDDIVNISIVGEK